MVVVVKRVEFFFCLFCGQNFLIVQSEKVLMILIYFCCVSSQLSFKRCGTLATKLTFNFQLLFHHFVHEIVMSFLLNFFFTTVFCTVENSNFSEFYSIIFTSHCLIVFTLHQSHFMLVLKFQFFNFFTISHTKSNPREISVSEFSHNTARKIFQH